MSTHASERILIVDDDPGFRRLLETILEGEGYPVESAGTVQQGIIAAKRTQFPLVLSDLRLPDGDGIMLLRWLRENSPATAVVMITAYGTVGTAVEAMKLGAADYLGKPLSSPDELRLLVRRTLERNQLAREYAVLAEQQNEGSCGDLIADDPRMHDVLGLIRKVAPTEATVLIGGESGTGKELVARCIHRLSARSEHVFIPVNCAALTASLIESELFGHEKGAFTGAVAQHPGRFERANKGTIFLDEIGELDESLQAKLLRVLQERTLERVGGTRQIDVDVRVIAATNRDLRQRVEDGKFREDLFYRLNLFPILLPPLRERPSDILRLASNFLAQASRRMGKATPRLSDTAESAMLAYGWPGNVRELENLMERVAILHEGEILAEDLALRYGNGHVPGEIFLSERPGPVSATSAGLRTVKELEKEAILAALRHTGGNRTQAAKRLGISVRTLHYRLKEYGVREGDSGSAN